jgi:uncharacterized protein (TIRG00374 family)
MAFETNIILIILGALAHILVTTVPALRSKLMYTKLKQIVSLKTLAEIHIIVSAFNVIAPFRAGGLLIRTYILKKRYNIPHKINLTAATIEQLVDLVVQAVLALFCVYLIGARMEINLTSKIIISSLALIGIIILFFWGGLKDLTYNVLVMAEKFMPEKIKKIIIKKSKIKKQNIVNLVKLIQEKDNKIKFILGLIVSTTIIYLIIPISFMIFVYAFGIKLSLIQIFVAFWLPLFLGRVSGIPGGFGVREASMIYVLNLMNVSMVNATSLTVTFRALSIGAIIIAGIVLSAKYGMNILKIKKKDKKSRE